MSEVGIPFPAVVLVWRTPLFLLHRSWEPHSHLYPDHWALDKPVMSVCRLARKVATRSEREGDMKCLRCLRIERIRDEANRTSTQSPIAAQASA